MKERPAGESKVCSPWMISNDFSVMVACKWRPEEVAQEGLGKGSGYVQRA